VWTIELSREALRALLRMPSDQALRIRRRLDELARDPRRARNVKKLTDHPGFRLRVGDYRVIYLLQDARLVVQVVWIAARGEVYR
jgi:mRNA interferase RelE/StbE